MKSVVLVVTGSRHFTDRDFVWSQLRDAWRALRFVRLIHGKATGVDALCGEWVRTCGHGNVIEDACPAEWDRLDGVPARNIRTRRDGTRYNVRAGFDRNHEMAFNRGATHGLIFPGNRGTADMAQQMADAGLSIRDLRGHYLAR